MLVKVLAVLALCAAAQAQTAQMTITPVGNTPAITSQDDSCQTCIEFQDNWINALLNAILHMELDTCGDLCGLLKNHLAEEICTLACDVVGIHAFVEQLKSGKIDVIYICQQHHKCPVDDNGSGAIGAINVLPPVSQRGATLVVNASITVFNHTGAGEFQHNITGKGQPPVVLGNIYEQLNPGKYIVNLQFATQENPQDQITWKSGEYKIETSFCMGQCGAPHPHTKFFGKSSATFKIHNDNDDDDNDDDPIG